jgi:uncharacterized SAM-binding protein YcdF (DUF218 family)
MSLSIREKFIVLVSNDTLKKSDAIIILEGDGLNRLSHGAFLFKEHWAPTVVISGGINKPPHSLPAKEMLPELLKFGVAEGSILLEEKSMNTREQAVEIIKLAKDKKWQSIIIVASHYHQYRAYLTFLKGMEEVGLKISIINSPARDLKWFKGDESAGGKRADILEKEFEKIEEYSLKGHIASFEDAVEYQKWKEEQR